MLTRTRFPGPGWPIAALALLGALALGPVAAKAADHLDGPRLMANPAALGALDINDVYAFQGFNSQNTVLIMTLSPAAGVLGPATFSPYGAYEFKVDNNGDAHEDITIRFEFALPSATGRQGFLVEVFDATGRVVLSGVGQTERNNPIPRGGQVRAGLFDDPFFFDLNTFNRFKAKAQAGDPTAAQEFLNRGVRNIPQNFFGGFNVLAIVLEVPRVLLQSNARNPKIGVWARTAIPFQGGEVQFDRMGRPGINTVLITDEAKDQFNASVPSHDASFIGLATGHLTQLFGNPTTAQAHARALLPDILTFDTTNGSGFLNGRRLTDDVIDAELSLLSNGGVKTDNVPNDSVFSSRFPYLGTPNPKTVTLRAMRAAVAGSQGGP